MKKVFATITAMMLLAVPSVCLSAQTDASSGASVEYGRDGETAKKSGKVRKSETLTLNQVVKKYKGNKKADYLKLDGFLLNLAKVGMKADDEMPAEAVDALKSMVILSMDDCSPDIRKSFRDDMSAALSNCEMILEAQDGEDKVGIYVGKMDEEYFENFIIYESDDCDLVVMQGRFPISALKRMVDGNRD